VCTNVIYDVEEQCINDKKIDHYKLEVLQINFAQFSYGQLRTLELHLGYDPGGIPHVAFLPIVANLVLIN
jgi:hypothetical protein